MEGKKGSSSRPSESANAAELSKSFAESRAPDMPENVESNEEILVAMARGGDLEVYFMADYGEFGIGQASKWFDFLVKFKQVERGRSPGSEQGLENDE